MSKLSRRGQMRAEPRWNSENQSSITKTNVTNFERYIDRDPESISFMDGQILNEYIYGDTIKEIMNLNGAE